MPVFLRRPRPAGRPPLIAAGLGIGLAGLFVSSTVALVKPRWKISNIKTFSHDGRNIGFAEQKIFPKGNRLIINGHGNGTRVGGYLPDELADAILDTYPNLDKKFKKARLISCHAANGGVNSPAKKLADRLNIEVKANEGVMWSTGPVQAIDGRQVKYLSIDKFTRKKNGTLYKYKTRTFKPTIRNP
jgi:hypothetical protein